MTARTASGRPVAMPRGSNDNKNDFHFVDIHVGKRLRWRREQMGMSRERLAAATGVSPQLIHKYECAVIRVSPSRHCFARHFDVSVTYLFESLPRIGDQPPKYTSTTLAEHDLDSRETAVLVEAYHRIADPKRRRAVYRMILAIAEGASAP
jgi:transcriptional regulator with XRE-family HTH domain